MKRRELEARCTEIYESCPGNVLGPEGDAWKLRGLRMFDAPLVGVAAADDPLFHEYLKDGIIGPWYRPPEQWVPEAKSVVSLFFPFSQEVRDANRASTHGPAPAWVYGRVDGQAWITAFMAQLRQVFTDQGAAARVPAQDPEFLQIDFSNNRSLPQWPTLTPDTCSSNWSERHAAFAAGLGTFGLSKGLITRRGMAGRFASLITTEPLEPDQRPYREVYEYCTRCGACISRCGGGAISLEHGKDHRKCVAYTIPYAKLYAPRFGCGLCQTGVPCEYEIPKKPL